MKLITNYMAFAAQAINGEALAMADALDISAESFYEVAMKSSGSNMILGARKTNVLNDDYLPVLMLDMVVKDLEFAHQMCRDAGIPNFTLNTALQLYRVAQAQGKGKNDSSAVIKTIRDLAKGKPAE